MPEGPIGHERGHLTNGPALFRLTVVRLEVRCLDLRRERERKLDRAAK